MEIVERLQAIKTYDGSCQPPHRVVDSAFHLTAFSYANTE
jgi:hypothetical protein